MNEGLLTRWEFLAMGTATGLLLAGCGRSSEKPAAEPADDGVDAGAVVEDDQASDSLPAKEDEGADAAATGAKVLVAYYSRADENYPGEWLEVGHTKVMAGYLVEALGADEYEIVPAESYPEGYDDCCDVALEEQHADARPAIANPLPDVSGYDAVMIGCPIWWGEEPMIVRTFLEAVDLSGKTIVPFTTHGGSGLGSVPANLQAAVPDATFLEGHAVAGTSVDGARDEVVSWATGLGIA